MSWAWEELRGLQLMLTPTECHFWDLAPALLLQPPCPLWRLLTPHISIFRQRPDKKYTNIILLLSITLFSWRNITRPETESGCYCIRLSSGPALERSVDKVDSTVSSRPKVCTRILRGERSDLRLDDTITNQRALPRNLRPIVGDWRGQAGVAGSGRGGRVTRKWVTFANA